MMHLKHLWKLYFWKAAIQKSWSGKYVCHIHYSDEQFWSFSWDGPYHLKPPLRAMDSPSFSQEAQQPPGTVNTRKQNRVPQMVLHPKEYFYITCLLGPKHYQGVAELTGFHGRIVCGLLGENPQTFIGWVNARQILTHRLGQSSVLAMACHLPPTTERHFCNKRRKAKQNEEPFIKWEEVIKLTLRP